MNIWAGSSNLMPFTPYHFGPSGLIGLALRKWIDVPVFVLANVAVDIEVLCYSHWPYHRYCHNFLIGGALGLVLGVVAYFAKPIFEWAMKLVRINYKANLIKMIVSGMLGVWLHVFIDGIYHYDVFIFWPSKVRPLWRLLSQDEVVLWCKLSFTGVAILYIFAVRSFNSRKKQSN